MSLRILLVILALAVTGGVLSVPSPSNAAGWLIDPNG
jgi:hypothetical protein